MILKNRLFQRQEPSRDAKSFYIFCEGRSREFEYFEYFRNLDSRINVVPVRTEESADNSPTGLFNLAVLKLVQSRGNPNPAFELLEDDEVWFAIDTDKWEEKIDVLRELCEEKVKWQVAQSNPCFEVWLYYHFSKEKPSFDQMEESAKWKSFVNRTTFKGGFDSRKHPIYVNTAIENAKQNYQEQENGWPDLAGTQVFRCAEHFYPLIQRKIEEGLTMIP